MLGHSVNDCTSVAVLKLEVEKLVAAALVIVVVSDKVAVRSKSYVCPMEVILLPDHVWREIATIRVLASLKLVWKIIQNFPKGSHAY